MLLTIQVILETLGGSLIALSILFILIARIKKLDCYYRCASIGILLTGIVWAINSIVEYFMQIYVSSICTVLLVCLCLFFGCWLDSKDFNKIS